MMTTTAMYLDEQDKFTWNAEVAAGSESSASAAVLELLIALDTAVTETCSVRTSLIYLPFLTLRPGPLWHHLENRGFK